MPVNVSDVSGNRNDKIANAAMVLGRSEARKRVFLAIYNGKTKIKTVSDIQRLSGLKTRVRVLQEAKKLDGEDIVKQLEKKVNGETAYEKIDFYVHNKKAIIRLAGNKEKLDKFPTKVNPRIQGSIIKISFPRNVVDVRQISIDDIDSFSKVKKDSQEKMQPLYENKIKEGFKKIIGEEGDFTDWGGETNDLFSTRLMLNGKRINGAFAFKGRGTMGILTPRKMGKNGEQIQRLFKSPADAFFVQYHGQIDESIIEQMRYFAIAKSVIEGKRIYFGVIDGKDTSRIITAYPGAFK